MSRHNVDALLAQKNTGQSDVDARIIKEALSYNTLDEQAFVVLYRSMGCRKLTDKKEIDMCAKVSNAFMEAEAEHVG